MLDNHYVPDDYGLLPYINIFGKSISIYSIFVGLGLFIGLIWFVFSVAVKEKVKGDKVYLIVISALFFGILGSKILVVIENIGVVIKDFSKIKYFIFTGKSIVGGLLGGFFGVRFIKKILKLDSLRTGNRIAPSIALGMAVGRIGCFLTGCCYGIETKLPIGINFGDGVNRIPTQLIECLFCFILFIYLFYKQKKNTKLAPGGLFLDLVLYYFIFRFFIEFIRGTYKNIMFLSIYQIICIIGIIFVVIKKKKENKKWMETITM